MKTPPQEIVVVGWYDGVTEAFVQEHDGRWTYASMIAWDPERKLRIFGVVRADAPMVSEIRARCAASDSSDQKAENWRHIRAYISEFLRNVDGEAELRLCEELDGETKDSRRIDAGAILDDLGHEIDEVVGSTRFASWISRFSTDE